MTIIETLKTDYNTYIDYCYKGLSRDVDVIFLDHSRSETTLSTILFIKKEDLSFKEAFSILTIRLLMYYEEWNNFSDFTRDDMIRISTQLEAKYFNTEFILNFTIPNDIDPRLTEKEILSIRFNNEVINFDYFETMNPLLTEKNIEWSISLFKSIQDEYYIETENHFVLFNWYTTA
jgi:hypothetical protein